MLLVACGTGGHHKYPRYLVDNLVDAKRFDLRKILAAYNIDCGLYFGAFLALPISGNNHLYQVGRILLQNDLVEPVFLGQF